MNKLSCHSGTSYSEIWEFINQHLGKTVRFHYEEKGYMTWGNDEVKDIILNEEGINWIKSYMGTELEYRNGNDAYVHNIELK